MKDLIERLSDLQIRRPWVPLLLVAAITLVFGYFTSKLELRTRYDALLPESQASVQELRRVEARTSSAQQVFIVLQGPDHAPLRAMGDALLPALMAIGPDVVSSAEDGIQAERSFLSPRAGLFLTLKELTQLRDDVNARWDYEVAKEEGSLLDDNGPPVTVAEIEGRFKKKEQEAAGGDERPDGYYERKDGKSLVVVVRSPIAGGDLARTGPALARSRPGRGQGRRPRARSSPCRERALRGRHAHRLRRVRPHPERPGRRVGATGIGLVLGIVLLYFMRIRAVFVMGLSIGVGLIWTFGLTQIFIGHLNVATGFLVSIVAGNGINVGILYQSRYFEERRKGVPTTDALRTAVRETWQATVIAALSSAAAYVSLLITSFSAFRHFGFIAATGMIMCWIVKTLMVPPLLLLLERRSPMATSDAGLLGRMRRFGMGYGRVFAWLVPKAPRVLLGVGVLDVVLGSVAASSGGTGAPRSDGLRPPQPRRTTRPRTRSWTARGGEPRRSWARGTAARSSSPIRRRTRASWRRSSRGPGTRRRRGRSRSWPSTRSGTWCPPIRRRRSPCSSRRATGSGGRARTRGFINDADWARVKDGLAPSDLRPYGLADLPESLARPYAQKDGSRGRLVTLEAEPSGSGDLRYLVRHSASFRETRLASGKVVKGSGNVVIFADVLQQVVHDGPRAVALSLALTILAVVVTFRRGGKHALSVLFALLVGVCGRGDLPLRRRREAEFPQLRGAPDHVRDRGGLRRQRRAALSSRWEQRHPRRPPIDGGSRGPVQPDDDVRIPRASRLGEPRRSASLGTIAVVGEVSCLLAAVLVLPALWLLIERRRR